MTRGEPFLLNSPNKITTLPRMFTNTFWPFFIALLFAALSVPTIIKVADLKHLMDEPDATRKLHDAKTPTLGGIAIFIGTIFSFSATTDYLNVNYDIKFMIPALLIIFFAGITDDMIGISPIKKLSFQFLCAILLTVFGSMRITNLWGMLGITDISPVLGMTLTFITIVSLINAFNLIDGINGLAGSLGLVAALFFGGWFALSEANSFSVLSFSLAGALVGFLFFNFGKAKIFMGDTGSMLIGFIISILAIKFIENNRAAGIEQSPFYIKAAPGVAIAAVIIPMFDMTQVFFRRLAKGRHPFSADRNHIHHQLLSLGFSHRKTCLVLVTFSLAFIALSLFLREHRSMTVIVSLLLIATCLQIILIALTRRHSK